MHTWFHVLRDQKILKGIYCLHTKKKCYERGDFLFSSKVCTRKLDHCFWYVQLSSSANQNKWVDLRVTSSKETKTHLSLNSLFNTTKRYILSLIDIEECILGSRGRQLEGGKCDVILAISLSPSYSSVWLSILACQNRWVTWRWT